MADLSPTSLDDLQILNGRLAEPEPMCVVLVTVEPWSSTAPVPTGDGTELAAAVEGRLLGTLRDYDELVALPGGRFAVLLPTLADAAGLRRRVDQLYDLLTVPYDVSPADDGERRGPGIVAVACVLGAAIRHPAEQPTEFLDRLARAFEEARRSGDGGPVLV